MNNQSSWQDLAAIACTASEAENRISLAQKEYADAMKKFNDFLEERLQQSTRSATCSPYDLELLKRISIIESDFRITSQSIEALAAELKELKSQGQKTSSHCDSSQSTTAIYSTSTQESRGAVAARIASHVQSKKEAFYPRQIARELDLPDCYVGKVLTRLLDQGVLRMLDNHGYAGRKLYMVNREV
ncbi:MAG TPA: hypothetical protein DCP31_08565 [Cyanobacteria bacterium UBA8543]|nr:hypothetical protein [Cyanobacteria bacterium UBA8543]